MRRARYGRLDEALATLITNQAMFVERSARADERWTRAEERTAQHFARIEAELAEIKDILRQQHRMLAALPEAICEKIGFVKPR